MNIVFEYEDSISDGTIYYYGLNRTHNSNGEIYVYNAHGDTIQLVKDNAVVVSYTYDAFGNLTSQIGESDNTFLYCSEYFDSETQTYYLRARYYDPANGRFTQQDAWAFMDTSDPLSLNLYTYCCNNPVLYADPSGHSFLAAALAVGAVVLKIVDYAWTAWDIADSTATLADKNADSMSKFFASLNIALAAGLEAVEPDDILPVGIPLDDATRKLALNAVERIYKKEGPVAVKNYLRKHFGNKVDDGIRFLDNVIQESVENTGKWAKGSYDSIQDSLVDHYYRHGKEVGAESIEQYLRKAEGFASDTKRAQKYYNPNGYTPGAVKYVKNGKYIILDPDKNILSFGKVK